MRTLLERTSLRAKSPRNAFYDLALIKIRDGYLVKKESGAGTRVIHKEAWFRETYEEATKLYQKILREKTNQKRKSPRKYTVVSGNSHFASCG